MTSECFKQVGKTREKWLFDGDCLICTYCGHAIDYHPKVALGGGYIVPKVCPKCQDEKTKLGIA